MSALTYRGTELRSMANGFWFHIVSGLYGGLKVKGEDPTIPGKRGRWAGNRLAEVRTVFLHGVVLGTSEDNYRTRRLALDALFDPELAAGNLVAGADYPGYASARTIAVKFINYFAKEDVDYHVAELDVQLETDDDPDWA